MGAAKGGAPMACVLESATVSPRGLSHLAAAGRGRACLFVGRGRGRAGPFPPRTPRFLCRGVLQEAHLSRLAVGRKAVLGQRLLDAVVMLAHLDMQVAEVVDSQDIFRMQDGG